jgi:hypothetical protein
MERGGATPLTVDEKHHLVGFIHAHGDLLLLVIQQHVLEHAARRLEVESALPAMGGHHLAWRKGI